MSRKETEAFILKYIDKILPGTKNVDLYRDKFKKMSNKEFDEWINRLENGEEELVIISPNFNDKYKLDVERNIGIAEELGHEFFTELVYEGMPGVPDHETPTKYLVLDLPNRRLSQILIKKIAIPENSRFVDRLTGQPTGNSAGASLTYPEVQVLAAMGLDNTVVELLKYRGGDSGGLRALNAMIDKYGRASQKVLYNYSSGVTSKRTLKTFLTAMHLKNNL